MKRLGEARPPSRPYSPRARAGATVSVPVAWEDLTSARQPGRFTLSTLPGRLKRSRKDPWLRFFAVDRGLPKSG